MMCYDSRAAASADQARASGPPWPPPGRGAARGGGAVRQGARSRRDAAHCAILYYTILHYTNTILYYTILYYTILY